MRPHETKVFEVEKSLIGEEWEKFMNGCFHFIFLRSFVENIRELKNHDDDFVDDDRK